MIVYKIISYRTWRHDTHSQL